VLGEVEVVDAKELLGPGNSTLGGRDRLVLLVVLVVVVRLRGVLGLAQRLQLVLGRDAGQLLGEPGEGVVGLGRLLRGAGDDQRGAGLVDEDVVDLVDDGEVVSWLHRVLERCGHVVAQVVEAELRVGAVGDVAGVLVLAGGVVVGLLDRGNADPDGVVDGLHPLGVAASQVVVDGDEVDALALQRVEEHGKGCGQGLALSRLHLRDRAVVQDHAPDQLHVVVALADRAPGGFAGQGEGLGQEVVERLAPAGALAQGIGLLADLMVLEQLHLRLDPVDRGDPLLVLPELPRLPHAERAVYEGLCHRKRC
jgi:hypothetical protein